MNGSRTTRLAALLGAVLAATAGIIAFTLPAAAAGTTYEAESAALSGGAVVATDHTGYTGSGFVGGYTDGNLGNANTTFTVSASAGASTVAVRYANGTTAQKTLSLYVNGTKLKQIALPATANWDTWATETETVTLNSGSNTVAYKFDTADSGNVNIDNILVTAVGAPPPGQLEAESAALAGGAAVATDHSGFTGTGFVGGYTDANKGNANTTFTVTGAGAGAGTVQIRYANGTGAQMTLSLYLNGAKLKQLPLPATANWDTWGTETENVTFAAGTNTVSYKFDTTDSGNVNLDNLVYTTASGSPSPSGSTTPPPSGQVYEAETSFVSGGPSVATATAGYTGTGYVTNFTATGARVIVTVNVPTAGNYAVATRYANASGSAKTLSRYVNGLKQAQVSLAAGSGWLSVSATLALRSGVNLIGWQYDSGDSGAVAVDDVSVTGGAAMAARGATMPYDEYVASAQTSNGTVLAASRTFTSLASEATGRRAVQLSGTGQYVQFTLAHPANALTVRYSIPDNAGGTGQTAPIALYANGMKLQDVTLTSKYSWVYGAYPYTNNPGDGSAHHFFDETRATFASLAAGTVVKLQKDSAALTYTIDLVDTEQVDAAFAAPAGFLTVASYGATANDGSDDTNAFNSAISAAQSQGKGLYVPSGTYNVGSRLNLGGIALRGAGEWYTVIQGLNGQGGFLVTGGNTQIADLTISGDSTYRNDCCDSAGVEGNFGTGSLLYDVWIEHTKVGGWIDSGTNGLYAVGLRVRDQFADGVNLHANVQNTRFDNSSVRNTGDDGLAMFSDGTAVVNSSFTFDTVQTPLLANGIAIYGGTNLTIADNLVSDTVTGSAGIAVSTRFGIPFSGTQTVTRNTVTRSGGYEPNWPAYLGAIWVYANVYNITTPVVISYNTINDSTYQAVLLSYGMQITNLTLDHDTITTAGTWGIDVYNVTGSMSASYVTVTGAVSGGLNNPGGYTINRGAGNSGW
jgi:hypothetical protein